MPHSDRTTGDDVLTREVVTQLANSAPPPPAWEAVADRFDRGDTRCRPAGSWHQLAMVAAVALAVAAGLVFVGRHRSDERVDLPVMTLPRPASPVITEWLEATDPTAVQLCLARSTLRLGRSAEGGPLENEMNLTGVTPQRAELTVYLSPVVVMRATLGSDELDPTTAASVGPVVDTWTDADEVVADPTSTAADRWTAVERFGEERDRYLAAPSTVDCVFDSIGVTSVVEASSASVGSLAVARCVSALGLDRSLDDLASRPDRSGTPALEAALAGFTVWDNRPGPAIAELGAAVVAARDAGPGARKALVDRARTELRSLEELASCPTWTDPAVLDLD